MATIDDVYNLLTNGDHGLAALATRIGPTGWVAGDPTTGDWAKLAGDDLLVGSPAWRILQVFGALAAGGQLDLLYHAFLSGDPDTLGQYISEARFASLDIINGYLKDPPDFDPGSNILKETKDLADKIWDAVHRTVSVPEE